MLYDLYKDRVYSIAFYFFHGDDSTARDLTQQVFLKLITAIRQFKGDATFSTWLYRLVVNACQDATRRRKSAGTTTGNAHLDEIAVATFHEEEYSPEQLARTVRMAVSSLPAKFRIAILLRYFHDLSYEQIARVLHCSKGTVASRLSRGHKLLAEELSRLNSALK